MRSDASGCRYSLSAASGSSFAAAGGACAAAACIDGPAMSVLQRENFGIASDGIDAPVLDREGGRIGLRQVPGIDRRIEDDEVRTGVLLRGRGLQCLLSHDLPRLKRCLRSAAGRAKRRVIAGRSAFVSAVSWGLGRLDGATRSPRRRR